jgi:hypothetical protein
VKLQIRSVFVLMYLGGTLASWPQEPANWPQEPANWPQEPLATTADVNSASAMSLEITLAWSSRYGRGVGLAARFARERWNFDRQPYTGRKIHQWQGQQ